jgi:hypothetical protein
MQYAPEEILKRFSLTKEEVENFSGHKSKPAKAVITNINQRICRCGCEKVFIPTHGHQRFFNEDHRMARWLEKQQQRRKKIV